MRNSRAALLLALIAAITTATPARPADLEPFTRAVTEWALKHKVSRAVLLVRREGRIVHTASVGGANPGAPVLLASLSKAITAACVATLVRDRRLALDWPMSRALARFFAANGRPSDPRLEKATIADLLTHRGGFPSARDGEDTSTRSVLNAYLARHSIRQPPSAAYLDLLLQRPLQRDPAAAFAYSNGNYLALGAVIEEATGQRYESYCRDAVLAPAGAAGSLDPAWAVMGAYGGWRMRGEDYLRFFDSIDPARAAWGNAVRDWMLDRTGKSLRAAGGREWYGLGVLMRETDDGIEIWHTGSWRRRMAPDAIGPRSAETSTLAYRAADGTSWFVHALPLVLDGARAELARALVEANRNTRHTR